MPPPLRSGAAVGLAYRSMTDDDLPFMAALYASTREEEMAAFGWPEAMQRSFLAQQHLAQERHFRAAYPDAEWLVVEQAGRPVGRLYVNENATALHGIDIALLPECRGSGLGGALVADLTAWARDLGKSVTFHVEKRNAGAARLYRRLGFETVEEGEVYDLLRWEAERPA